MSFPSAYTQFPYTFPIIFDQVAPTPPQSTTYTPPPVKKSYQQWNNAMSPAALKGAYAVTWLGAHGYIKDWLTARLKAGILQRLINFAAPDALAQIGIERGIAKSPIETVQAYALRLLNAWSTWRGAGTAETLLNIFAVFGYSPLIVQQNQWIFSLNGGRLVTTALPAYGGGTMDDPFRLGQPQWLFSLGQPATFGGQVQPVPVVTGGSAPNDLVGQPENRRWARYAVIFPQPLPAGPAPLPNWTDIQATLSASTSPSLAEVNTIRQIIAQWGPGISACQGIYAVTNGQLFGYPTVTWQGSDTWSELWSATAVKWSPRIGSVT